MLFIRRNRLTTTVAILTLVSAIASVSVSGGIRGPSESGAGDAAGSPDVDVYVEVNYYAPKCNTDSDCTVIVRSRSPRERHEGVTLCKCYASSSINPFDECEGEAKACLTESCANNCIGTAVYCSASSICELRYYDVETE